MVCTIYLKYYIVVQTLVINIGICFASNYNAFLADDLSYGNGFRERSSIGVASMRQEEAIASS